MFKTETAFVNSLNRKSYLLRPMHRRDKGCIDNSCPYAFIMPDLASEYISCEIKVYSNISEYFNTLNSPNGQELIT